MERPRVLPSWPDSGASAWQASCRGALRSPGGRRGQAQRRRCRPTRLCRRRRPGRRTGRGP
eukprot:3904849-Alexandrium_andersonii.AAC.1